MRCMPHRLAHLRRVALAVALLVAGAACTNDESAAGGSRAPANPDPAQNTYAPALNVNLQASAKTAEGLYYRDVQEGTGQVAVDGRQVRVHYTGWLPDGTKFDSSRDSGTPLEFVLGRGMVIRGWDLGVAGMRVGGRRTLVIPAELGYGANGAPPDIPPNAVLVFDVELLEVR